MDLEALRRAAREGIWTAPRASRVTKKRIVGSQDGIPLTFTIEDLDKWKRACVVPNEWLGLLHDKGGWDLIGPCEIEVTPHGDSCAVKVVGDQGPVWFCTTKTQYLTADRTQVEILVPAYSNDLKMGRREIVSGQVVSGSDKRAVEAFIKKLSRAASVCGWPPNTTIHRERSITTVHDSFSLKSASRRYETRTTSEDIFRGTQAIDWPHYQDDWTRFGYIA